MPVIAIVNPKGGVGRTSTCYHLAGTLARAGRRVLLVDNTTQASLSQSILGPDETDDLAPASTLDAVYRGMRPRPKRIVRASGVAGVDLVAGSGDMSVFDASEGDKADWELQHALREFLASVRDCYDLVLIDCPPAVTFLSWAALVASDGLVVPIQPDGYGVHGVITVRQMVDRATSRVNPGLRLLGYLLSRVKPSSKLHRMCEQRLRREYGADIFATTVPDSADFLAAIGKRRPVGPFKTRSAASLAIGALAEEIESRLAGRTWYGETGPLGGRAAPPARVDCHAREASGLTRRAVHSPAGPPGVPGRLVLVHDRKPGRR